MDENECSEPDLNICHENAQCHNELGGYSCHCDRKESNSVKKTFRTFIRNIFATVKSYFVDNSTRYNLKAGTDCINPCLNTNSTSNPCQNGGICIAAYQVLGSKFQPLTRNFRTLIDLQPMNPAERLLIPCASVSLAFLASIAKFPPSPLCSF